VALPGLIHKSFNTLTDPLYNCLVQTHNLHTQDNLVQPSSAKLPSEATHACSALHISTPPLDSSATTSLQMQEHPPASSHAPLFLQLVAEVSLLATEAPLSRRPAANLPEPSTESSSYAAATPGTAKGSTSITEECARKLTESEGSHKLASELRTLCTALLAIPDKLASVFCACPAPLRPRNLLPQLFTCIIRHTPAPTTTSSVNGEIGARGGGCLDEWQPNLQRRHVHVAVSALISSATLRGHADIVARWLHQQDAHAWLHNPPRSAARLKIGSFCPAEEREGVSIESQEEDRQVSCPHNPDSCATCMCVSGALAQALEASVHERFWHALLEASVQKLETRKASSSSLVDMHVSRRVCANFWLRGTVHALPEVQQVQFWVKVLTVRGARLPPAALMHVMLVCCFP
jgi:hypothetical protein